MLYETELDFTDPRDRKKYYIEMTLTRRVVTPLAQALFSIMGELHCSGVENLPETGSVVLAANHLTNFDVFPMQFVLPRLIFYMGKAELFQNPFLDALLRRLGGFPVYRGARDEWALRQARRVLEQGQVLGIFPEGRRSKGRGLGPGKTGAAKLAIEMGCPIVPLAVTGTHTLFIRFPQRTDVTISLGKPIYTDSHDSPLGLTERVMFAIADLLPPELRGVYTHRDRGFPFD
jgi:1-acyl-sn-glycerol-3-phosphate acyltransferase